MPNIVVPGITGSKRTNDQLAREYIDVDDALAQALEHPPVRFDDSATMVPGMSKQVLIYSGTADVTLVPIPGLQHFIVIQANTGKVTISGANEITATSVYQRRLMFVELTSGEYTGYGPDYLPITRNESGAMVLTPAAAAAVGAPAPGAVGIADVTGLSTALSNLETALANLAIADIAGLTAALADLDSRIITLEGGGGGGTTFDFTVLSDQNLATYDALWIPDGGYSVTVGIVGGKLICTDGTTSYGKAYLYDIAATSDAAVKLRVAAGVTADTEIHLRINSDGALGSAATDVHFLKVTSSGATLYVNGTWTDSVAHGVDLSTTSAVFAIRKVGTTITTYCNGTQLSSATETTAITGKSGFTLLNTAGIATAAAIEKLTFDFSATI